MQVVFTILLSTHAHFDIDIDHVLCRLVVHGAVAPGGGTPTREGRGLTALGLHQL